MTNNSPGNANKLCFLAVCMFFVLALSVLTNGCADDPSSLGLTFIPPGDTTGIKIFDSRIDTMPITFRNIRKYVNNLNSGNLTVGQNNNNNYNAKSLVKFTNLDVNHDSATVNSATLTLTYRNYYFPLSSADSLAPISFDIYTVNQNVDYSTFTVDSLQASTFGTTSQGTYTGTPTSDTEQVTISLNTTMVKDWLEFAANNSYPVVNNGMVLSPNPSSAVLKAFYSSAIVGDVRPTLTIISTKNGHTDTLTTRDGQSLPLITGTPASSLESFPLQAGIAYKENISFDISRLPANVTINDVQLYMSLDAVNSAFTSQTVKTIIPAYSNGVTGDTAEGLPNNYDGVPVASGSNNYVFRLIQPFQRWLQGQTNYGLLLTTYNQNLNLDLFYFYNSSASDVSKRPYVIIKYTPRVGQ